MIFTCQKDAIQELEKLARNDRHSVLIEGPSGCGKTYLAKQYASMLNVDDFEIIQPKVTDIRETIDTCGQLENKIVLCIENLDKGVAGASYTLLKSLEEPRPNIYIIITVSNMEWVPDTIISRSTVVSTNPPISSDIEMFSRKVNEMKYSKLKDTTLWRCVRTLADANTILNMSDDHISYFDTLPELFKFKTSVASIMWKMGHFEDNSDTPAELVIRYAMEILNTNHVRRAGIQCISDMQKNRIAQHVILAKFAFECKYWE